MRVQRPKSRNRDAEERVIQHGGNSRAALIHIAIRHALPRVVLQLITRVATKVRKVEAVGADIRLEATAASDRLRRHGDQHVCVAPAAAEVLPVILDCGPFGVVGGDGAQRDDDCRRGDGYAFEDGDVGSAAGWCGGDGGAVEAAVAAAALVRVVFAGSELDGPVYEAGVGGGDGAGDAGGYGGCRAWRGRELCG